MKNVNQRLKRLTETDLCQAEVAEEYRKELLQLADDEANAEDQSGDGVVTHENVSPIESMTTRSGSDRSTQETTQFVSAMGQASRK